MDDIQGIMITDLGLREFIKAFEYCLGYECIDTSKMSRKQLLKYFSSIRQKADIMNNPGRKALWGDHFSRIIPQMFEDMARMN